MILKNKFDKLFGPSGSSTGLFLFIGGMVITYFSLMGLVFVFLGAFIGFTYTSTIIDTNKKRVKSRIYIFGVIPYGKWIDIKQEMKLGLKKSNIGYHTSTRGHSRDFHNKDIRIILYDQNARQIIAIEKFSNKLKEFYKYDFKTFLSELKKKKITLTLQQQDEWEPYFNEYKNCEYAKEWQDERKLMENCEQKL